MQNDLKEIRCIWPFRSIFIVLLLGVVTLSLSCGTKDLENQPIQVAAAASLQFALPEIAEEFRKSTGIRVHLYFSASGNIAHQIKSGAPIDLFCSADDRWITFLSDLGMVKQDTVFTYALGTLVIARSKDYPGILESVSDLKDTEIFRIGISNPSVSPYGWAAKEVLVNSDVMEGVRDRLILSENVGQVLNYLRSGDVDVGLVPRPLAQVSGLNYILVEEKLYSPVKQSMAIPLASPHSHNALKFVRFLLGPTGQRILSDNGFDLLLND